MKLNMHLDTVTHLWFNLEKRDSTVYPLLLFYDYQMYLKRLSFPYLAFVEL